MNFIEVSECNVCGNKDISQFCDIPEFPLLLRPLPPAVIESFKNEKIPAVMPLRIGICRVCGHMVLLLKPPDEIFVRLYKDFYGTYLSKLELGFATEDADNFLALFNTYLAKDLPDKAKVFEIGCYDGYVLSHLHKMGMEVLGCDPSDGASIGQKQGINIIHDFYSPDTSSYGSFDVVMNRHLIEHINSPIDFVASFQKALSNSGYIMIETPNGAYHLQNGLLDPFHFEHLSVFTPTSLSLCLRKAGFQIKHMFSSSINLIAICKKNIEAEQPLASFSEVEKIITETTSFSSRLKAYFSQLNSLIENISREGSSIGIWGAGSFGISILSISNILREKVVAVVDRDCRKHGLSLLNMNIEIKSPEHLINNPLDYIVVCSQYGTEIVRDIKERFKLDSAIVLLSPTIKVIK